LFLYSFGYILFLTDSIVVILNPGETVLIPYPMRIYTAKKK
jgi:hypothetical protein